MAEVPYEEGVPGEGGSLMKRDFLRKQTFLDGQEIGALGGQIGAKGVHWEREALGEEPSDHRERCNGYWKWSNLSTKFCGNLCSSGGWYCQGKGNK